jgi:hypothetical protein
MATRAARQRDHAGVSRRDDLARRGAQSARPDLSVLAGDHCLGRRLDVLAVLARAGSRNTMAENELPPWIEAERARRVEEPSGAA